MVFRTCGAEDGDKVAIGEIVFCTTGAHWASVQRRAVGDNWFSEGTSKESLVAMVHGVRLGIVLSDIGHFHATRNAVLLPARGRGTPGARVRVVVYHGKRERSVFYKTQVVEERLVRADGENLEAVILVCKLASFRLFSAEDYLLALSINEYISSCVILLFGRQI